jgi:putative oxidoreductase
MKNFGLVVGRILIGILFVFGALGAMLNWDGVCQYFTTTMQMWQLSFGTETGLGHAAGTVASLAPVFVGLATLFKLLGGLSVLFGYQTRMGAILLILFMIPATILFHAFWMMSGPEASTQQIMLLKNLGILGGLFYVAVFKNGEECGI